MDITPEEIKRIFCVSYDPWTACENCPCDCCQNYCPHGCTGADDKAKGILNMFKGELERTNDKMPEMSSNVCEHEKVCQELSDLYARKNHDYGDSFHLSYLEEGMAMPRIRLGDKFNRFKILTRHLDLLEKEQKVTDESVRDTLIDLANYAIMTIMEMDREAKHDPE